MAWKDTLLPASFRGIEFEIEATDDFIERAVVAHDYPYADGANTEDMGRTARPISLCAIFYGEDYETRMQEFIDAVDVPGTGELIHPIFGSITAQFQRARISHSVETTDFARLTLEFIEGKLNAPLFDRVLPQAQVEAVNEAADATLDASDAAFGFDFTKVPNLPSMLKEKLGADMLNAIGNMRSLADQVLGARTWIASGLYYLNNPTAFLDDLSGGLVSRVKGIFSPMNLRLKYGSGITGTAAIAQAKTKAITGKTSRSGPTVVSSALGYTRGSLADVWKAPLAHLKQPLLTLTPAPTTLPTGPFITTLSTTGPETQPFLRLHVQVNVTVAIASAAAQVFALDLDDAVLTPADIQTIAADARTAIAEAIQLTQATYPDITQSRPITEPLKLLAVKVSEAAERLIRARPPLIDRRVDTPGNLQLLAHLWYGDHRRADELLRLNPQVITPNFISGGSVLRAYVS